MTHPPTLKRKSPPPLSKSWWEEVKQDFENHPGCTHICLASGRFRASYAAGGKSFKAIVKLAQIFVREKYPHIGTLKPKHSEPLFPFTMTRRSYRLEFLDWNINRLSK